MIFNFEDPGELLNQLKIHRGTIHFESVIQGRLTDIDLKSQEIKRLEVLLEPFDLELMKIRNLRDIGSLDRIGYREAVEKYQSQQLELMRKISGLKNESTFLELQIKSILVSLGPARAFLNYFESTVTTYSIVDFTLKNQQIKRLLAPDELRQVFYFMDIEGSSEKVEILATKSDLGKALLGQRIGLVASIDYRFNDLKIDKTAVASDTILNQLRGVYLQNGKTRSYKLQSKNTSGGAIQRWRDGARGDAYIPCKRCDTLYLIGSTCEC